jgi:mannose-1-phosphate guanylyltransferase
MKHDGDPGALWAIVLAAGRGLRLAAVTKEVHGREIPKQFAKLCGERTFVQRTMDRIAPLVPPERTVVVVGDDQMDLAKQQLAGFAGLEIVRQPLNLGTGPGVLLPLAHVLAKDPDARVVVFPSDHHFMRDGPLLDAVRRADRAAAARSGAVTLVGAAADSAATDLGWIVGGPRRGPHGARARRVDRFIEKPGEGVARRLLRDRALWNTLIIAARGQTLWQLAGRHVPEIVKVLEDYRGSLGRPGAQRRLRAHYAALPPADFSRDILERAQGLSVVTMTDAGWSDCGTPERLFRIFGDPRAAEGGPVSHPQGWLARPIRTTVARALHAPRLV